MSKISVLYYIITDLNHTDITNTISQHHYFTTLLLHASVICFYKVSWHEDSYLVVWFSKNKSNPLEITVERFSRSITQRQVPHVLISPSPWQHQCLSTKPKELPYTRFRSFDFPIASVDWQNAYSVTD